MYHLYFHSLKTFSFEVHGSWSTWSMWDPCTKTCDGGKMTRRRYCDDPPPLYGGSACVGSSFYQDYQVKYSTFVCFISPFPQTDGSVLVICCWLFRISIIVWFRIVLLIVALVYIFLKKMLKDKSPFCGATDTPVLDFLLHKPWVSKLGLISHCCALSLACNGSLTFTSGAIPADLLMASMAAESFWSTYLYTYFYTSTYFKRRNSFTSVLFDKLVWIFFSRNPSRVTLTGVPTSRNHQQRLQLSLHLPPQWGQQHRPQRPLLQQVRFSFKIPRHFSKRNSHLHICVNTIWLNILQQT